MTVALLALWPLLRAYSDWYLDLGKVDTQRLTFGVSVIALASILIAVNWDRRRPTRVVATAMTILATLVTVVGAVSPTWLGMTANWLESWTPTFVVIGYALFLLSLMAVLWYFLCSVFAC